MFIAKLPLLFIVRATPDLTDSTLNFSSGYMAVRFQEVPGLISTPAALRVATPPWSIAEAPPCNGARIFIVKFDGAQMTSLVQQNPNHPMLLALVDQRVIDLDVNVGAIPPEGYNCGNVPLVVDLSLKLALDIS